MKLIAESHEHSSLALVGGKGSHLQKLVSWGAPVPPFFVVTTEAFRIFNRTGTIPLLLEKRFEDFMKRYPRIALRSSMISEDNVDSSFAGLFDTLLDVTPHNWRESLKLIFKSVESPRVREYISKKNIEVDLQMAVVAQQLIQVEKSGVLFTRSPVEPTAAVAIDAGYGLGEGVVSGLADVDNYQLTRMKELISVRVNNEKQVLCESEMNELIDLGIRLEKAAGSPSDIEWGLKDGKLYLFQIRPITRAFSPLTYFVDTNLSESYPGVVSPFTASFVKKAYENVFKESALIMGARGSRLHILGQHYSRLISSVDDHLYYNLEHYYAVLRALPGGEKNIDNWHKMIGGKLEGNEIPYHPTELNNVETAQTVFQLLKLGFGKKKIYAELLSSLESLRGEIESDIAGLKNPSGIIRYLNHLINRPLGFGLTVVNDVFIMMGLGYLTKVVKKKGMQEDEVIDLLKTHEGVDSVKPLEHFNEMVKGLSSDFIQSFSQVDLRMGFEPYTEIFKTLEKLFPRDVNSLRRFLELYGDRSFEELKLESLPLRNDPLLMKNLIVWAQKNPSLSKHHQKTSRNIELGSFDSKILNFTRDAIAMREATRLWRGKFYHLLRQLVLSLTKQMMEQDSEWREFSILDFFSLSPVEWLAYAEGKFSKKDVMTLMNDRKGWQTKKKNYPEIIPWVETEPLPVSSRITSTGSLEGQGVSPGITEGVALVLENPQDALSSDYKDFILVTKNTDPAWVYIMSRSLGLISEKGSLLSHTAIIGRELNIPTIVGVRQATQKIKTGDRLRIDATKGTIEIL